MKNFFLSIFASLITCGGLLYAYDAQMIPFLNQSDVPTIVNVEQSTILQPQEGTKGQLVSEGDSSVVYQVQDNVDSLEQDYALPTNDLGSFDSLTEKELVEYNNIIESTQ